MKKIYMNPTMEVVEINTNVQLLAGSTLSVSEEEVNDIDKLLSKTNFSTNNMILNIELTQKRVFYKTWAKKRIVRYIATKWFIFQFIKTETPSVRDESREIFLLLIAKQNRQIFSIPFEGVVSEACLRHAVEGIDAHLVIGEACQEVPALYRPVVEHIGIADVVAIGLLVAVDDDTKHIEDGVAMAIER